MTPASAPVPFRLPPSDAARYARLRRRMLHEAPWAFDAVAAADEAAEAAHLASWLSDEQAATFAVEAPRAFGEEPVLVAAATVTRGAAPKFAHRARISAVFVDAEHRGQGLGAAVVKAAIRHARGWPGVDFVDLGVSENSPAALRLYERLGFRAWGREPEATEHAGRRYDEIHMALRL